MSDPTQSEWPEALRLDAQPGPASYLTRAKADAMIFGALEQAGLGDALPAVDTVVSSQPSASRGRGRGTGARLAVAAALLAAFAGIGSASAAVMWYLGEQQAARAPVAAPAAREPAKRVRRPAAKVHEPAPAPGPAVLPEMVVEASPLKAERRAPEDWLEEGNRLRAERRWGRADEAYSRAFESAPKSQIAYVARVAAAAVRLEHLADARGALALYRMALRQHPGGALREEILLGIADAERALGDRAAEQRTLNRLLAEYPHSAHADEARGRLDE